METPFYYYDMHLLRKTLDTMCNLAKKYSLSTHYAIKANWEERICREISSRGVGVDCVSGNELVYAEKCGFDPHKAIFSGVGKTDKEIVACLERGIFAFNAESVEEIEVISQIAASMGCKAGLTIRINPDIDAHTHRYITTGLEENKFGISSHQFDQVISMVRQNPHVEFKGLHFHVGSQIIDRDVFTLEVSRAEKLIDYFEARGLVVSHIDFGGGLGVDYENPEMGAVPDFEGWFSILSSIRHRPDQTLHVEPGRSIVAQCGSLISRVVYAKVGKSRTFLILDAGMTDLIRPALYGAYHKIDNLSALLRGVNPDRDENMLQEYDVVGPVCESSDVWAQGRRLPFSCRGDLMALRSAGAYGSSMASRYNLRDLAPAIFSDDIGVE